MRATAVLKEKRTAKSTRSAPSSSAKPRAVATERRCSIANTVSILSDAWTFLVIREAFFGAKRFEEFRSSLDISRATLTDRLRRLSQEGILRETHYSDTSSRVEYRLTKAGIDLYPTFIALMQFGDRWLSAGKGGPLELIHEDCGCVSRPIVACSCCHGQIKVEEVEYFDGPGARRVPAEAVRRARRTAEDFMRGRPSSVSRALEIVGDRWSFLILREAFYGAQRFDQLQTELRIATNVLTERLARLVDRGIFRKLKYQSMPERFEYTLTPLGLNLFGPMMMMMAWGDRWRSNGRAPVLLKHLTCGREFTPEVICDHCGRSIQAHAMKYRMRYNPNKFGGTKSGRAMPGRV